MDGVRPLLLIRADANSKIGSGHLMRCGALAVAWLRRGGRAAFASRPLPEALQSQLAASGCEFLPLPETADPAVGTREPAVVRELVRTMEPTWLVFDGYSFDLAYQQIVAGGARDSSILSIDDRDSPQEIAAGEGPAPSNSPPLPPNGQAPGDKNFWARLFVLNQNVFANPRAYPALARERLLCGPSFALLREEFRRAAEGDSPAGQDTSNRPRRGGESWRVLVTMGGADPANGTARVLRSLAAVRDLPIEIHVALGAGNPQADAIRELAEALPLSIRIEHNVSDMATWMRRGDVAIAAAGSTAYELAACGVPSMLVVTAANQRPVARGMAEVGCALNLGEIGQLSPALLCEQMTRLLADENRRRGMAAAGRRMVDGRGAERVAEFLWEHSLSVRPATIDDARQLFAWQQDPAVRAASFTAGPADFAEHRQWMEKTMADPNMLIELVMLGPHVVIGCVRWTIRDGRGTIGIVLDPAYRGRGLAPLMLRRAVQRLSEIRPDVAAIDAWIRPENQSSRRAFAAAGFVQQRMDSVLGQPAELWQLEIAGGSRKTETAAA